jgi:hypothetical protein
MGTSKGDQVMSLDHDRVRSSGAEIIMVELWDGHENACAVEYTGVVCATMNVPAGPRERLLCPLAALFVTSQDRHGPCYISTDITRRPRVGEPAFEMERDPCKI